MVKYQQVIIHYEILEHNSIKKNKGYVIDWKKVMNVMEERGQGDNNGKYSHKFYIIVFVLDIVH